MTEITIQSKIDINNVVQRFSKLNISELELLVNQFNVLIEAKKAKSKKKRIKELTNLIHQSVISNDKLKEYTDFIKKIENQSITNDENQEFLKLVEEDENLRNQRVTYMLELSQLKQVPFAQIRKKFSFKSASNV